MGPLDAGPELDRLAATIDQMADRLQVVRDQEQRVEQTRRDLITAVSHDLRTPLANLRAMVEAIDERVVTDPPTIRRYVVDMRRSVAQLSSLVNDLFEMVQVDAGAIEAETDRAQLEDVVASAIATVEVEAARKGVLLATDVRGTEAAMCSPHLIRVLQNLLVNAVRHTPADGTIRVEGRHHPGAVRLVVEDTGEGISEARPASRLRPLLPSGRSALRRAVPAWDSRSRNGSSMRSAARSRSPAGPIAGPDST